MSFLVPIGRILFSWIFLKSIVTHFNPAAIAMAETKGLPFAAFLVPASGVLAFIGGLSISLGYYTRMGAWMIVLFLLPVTFTMHAFWKETDPSHVQMQLTNFTKNIAMLGGALLITWFGAGPFSIDEWLASKK